MANSKYFDHQSFSLVLTHNNHKDVVTIPYIKKGFRGAKVGGSKTFLMAIDAYTTKFKDRDELLNDIRKKGYADIKEAANDEIKIEIVCNDKRPFSGNLDIVFSDNTELVDFIQNNEIKAIFPSDGHAHANKYVKNFIAEVVEKITSYEYSREYRKLILNPNAFYKNNISLVLQEDLDENNLKFDGHYMNPLPFYEYYNIRGHSIFHQRDLELTFRERAYYDIPKNELGERENREELREIQSQKRAKKLPSKLDISISEEIAQKPIKKQYTIDPEEQISALNNPVFIEEQNKEQEEYLESEEAYFDYLSDYLDYLEPYREIVPYEELGEFNYEIGSNEHDEFIKKHKGNH